MMLRCLGRLRPYLPAAMFHSLRDAYWRNFWARELAEQRQQLGDGAANALSGSERAVLAEAIGDCYPFRSLLEVGCSYGQLFHIIGKQYRNVRMLGIDPDAGRIAGGRPFLEKERLSNIELRTGRAEELAGIGDRSFDVVVTSASMLYLQPAEIERAASELMRVAARRLLLLEQHIEEPGMALGRKGVTRGGEETYWLRNYRELFETFAPPGGISVLRVPRPLWTTESWPEHAHLITIRITEV